MRLECNHSQNKCSSCKLDGQRQEVAPTSKILEDVRNLIQIFYDFQKDYWAWNNWKEKMGRMDSFVLKGARKRSKQNWINLWTRNTTSWKENMGRMDSFVLKGVGKVKQINSKLTSEKGETIIQHKALYV